MFILSHSYSFYALYALTTDVVIFAYVISYVLIFYIHLQLHLHITASSAILCTGQYDACNNATHVYITHYTLACQYETIL